VTCNGNQLVTEHVETRITEGGVFYPITPSTEGGEIYQQSYAQGELNVFGQQKIAIECEGEHAAQGGATAFSVAGRRTVNFTSGQGIVYAMEQYYHAPGKLSTMVLEIGARALTKHALNVHCAHDDFYAALDTGWTMLVARDAQQAADHALILRKGGIAEDGGQFRPEHDRFLLYPTHFHEQHRTGIKLDYGSCRNEVVQIYDQTEGQSTAQHPDLSNPNVCSRMSLMQTAPWEEDHPGWYVRQVKCPHPDGTFPGDTDV
jgi:hypothetical protein